MNLAYKAMMFAREVHKDQVRKYTGNPYVDHLAEVVGIAMSVGWCAPLIHPDKFMSVCWLHDCIEDHGVTYRQLLKDFGLDVAHGVLLLSDLEEGNRAERKAASRERLSKAPGWIQTIKCADLISNTSSIVKHDPDFAKVYLEEKRLLLEVLTEANHDLRALAMSMLERAENDEDVKKHWYSFSFSGIDNASKSQCNASTYIGYADKFINKSRILYAKEAAGVSVDAVLLNVSYLGYMTKDHFLR